MKPILGREDGHRLTQEVRFDSKVVFSGVGPSV